MRWVRLLIYRLPVLTLELPLTARLPCKMEIITMHEHSTHPQKREVIVERRAHRLVVLKSKMGQDPLQQEQLEPNNSENVRDPSKWPAST